MVRVFIEHKELKPLWGFARNLETHDQMNSNQMLKAHGEKLFSAIDMAVNSLDDMNNLVPILVQLGSGHCKWGVKEEHFEIIGKVLIETLQDALQEKFTPKVKRVWIKLFNIVSMHMKYGIRQQNDMETSKHLNKQTVDIHILNENDISINGNCLSLNNNGNFSKVFPNDGTHEMD
ncbi:unnamed protein product [Brachionus calyciflorus]|uniref:Globin domain-containing protein n=1 Tax=Brachionus calyciflorus TaxID=104777 RepID=A0A813XA76_9BILA|nr:unnamed protein product [Brachionus calyciflorus]